MGHTTTEHTSSYTLTFGADEWHAVKLLATYRRVSLRELIRRVLREEVERARRSGELPNRNG